MFRTATMGGNSTAPKMEGQGLPKNRGNELPQIIWGNEFPLVLLGTVYHGISIYIHIWIYIYIYNIYIYLHIYIYVYISHMRFTSTTLTQDQAVSVTTTFGSLIPHFQVPFLVVIALPPIKMPYKPNFNCSRTVKYHIVGVYIYIYIYTHMYIYIINVYAPVIKSSNGNSQL